MFVKHVTGFNIVALKQEYFKINSFILNDDFFLFIHLYFHH